MTIAENYKHLLQEIAKECELAKRNPNEVKLIVVSKTHSWNVVNEVYDAGGRTFGENRVQEALLKKDEAPADVAWHLIGPLQTNKINKAIGQFALIHSVDSLELAKKISEASLLKQVETHILLQVNTSGELSKQGFTSETIHETYPHLAKLPSIKIDGLMTMAPFTDDKDLRMDCFTKLKEIRDSLGLKELSMGMSNDWREAIHAGSTMLRIGSAIFGARTV